MFKKENLKNGMVVEFNNGEKRLVWEGRLIDEHGFIPMFHIDANLYNTDCICSEYIVNVFLSNNVGYLRDFFSDRNLTYIWSRNSDNEINQNQE